MGESDNSAVLVRVWMLGEFRIECREHNATWKAIEKSVWANNYGRHLLKRLLCSTNRRVARSDLLEDLWPNTPMQLAERYLNSAGSKLRQVFDSEEIIKPYGLHGTGGYQLARQALVWTDIDACEALIKEAECSGVVSSAAFPLLEKASAYFERGGMLEGESGQWCLASRSHCETIHRYCRLSLADNYEAQNMFWHARSQYHKLFEVNPIDEDALCRLLTMLHRRGMRNELHTEYAEAKRRFKAYDMPLSDSTKKFFQKLVNELPPITTVSSPPIMRLSIADRPGQHEFSSQLAYSSSLTYNGAKLSTLPNLDMLMRSRRQILHDMLNAACTTLTLSPYALLSPDGRERFEVFTTHTSYVDKEALGDLAAITQRYWGLSKNASIDLLSGIAGHFTTIVQLLKESHPTPIYEQLSMLMSENAMLLGKTFHDIREYDLAWEYYKFSLKIARDTQNNDLWANGVGRIALLFIYWGQPQNALPLLHEAQKKEIRNQRLRPWLSAIEAEIYAMVGNVDECVRALERARSVTLPTSLDDDIYATGFNPSRAAGYEGASFVRLCQPERALPALEEAFALCDPTSLRRRSTLLADIGTVYAQLGDAKKACSLILQSVDMTAQTKSLVVLQRIYKGRAELDPWKDSAEVKILDERVSEMFTTLTKLKEHV